MRGRTLTDDVLNNRIEAQQRREAKKVSLSRVVPVVYERVPNQKQTFELRQLRKMIDREIENMPYNRWSSLEEIADEFLMLGWDAKAKPDGSIEIKVNLKKALKWHAVYVVTIYTMRSSENALYAKKPTDLMTMYRINGYDVRLR